MKAVNYIYFNWLRQMCTVSGNGLIVKTYETSCYVCFCLLPILLLTPNTWPLSHPSTGLHTDKLAVL